MKSSRFLLLVGRAALTVLVSSALVLACSGDDDAGGKGSSSGTTPAAAQKDPLNAAPGTLGGACDSDANCTAGLKCITPAGIPTGAKYCASTCDAPAACEAFAKTSFSIPIPLDPDGFGPNQWNRTVLERGVVCGQSPDVPGGAKYCQFVCPENSAIEDQAKGCACLPRYKSVRNGDGKLVKCEWDDQSSCSIINYPGRRNICDACNSKPFLAGCYTGDYVCAVNRSFNGTCYQWTTASALDACISQSTSDCDETCYENCAGSGGDSPGVATSSNCVNLCCKSSSRPATQPPTCTGTPGTGSSSSSGGIAADAGGSSTSSSGGVQADAGGSSSGGSSGGGSSSGQ